MIVFDLKCLDGGEVFEGWFSSGAEYDEQAAQGLVQCPYCSSARIEKAPMAPRVTCSETAGADAKAALARLSALQQEILGNSTWVGDDFPAKARAMHHGEIEPAPVHGRASADEARSLADEGVPILPLPLPILPPGQVN